MKYTVQYRIRLSGTRPVSAPGTIGKSRRETVQNSAVSLPADCGSVGRNDEASLPRWPRKHIPTFPQKKKKTQKLEEIIEIKLEQKIEI